VLLYRAQPLLINVQSIYTAIASYAIAIMGALVIVTALSKNWRSAPVMIAIAAAVTLPAVQYGALSSGGDDTVRQMAKLVQEHRTGNEEVGTMGVFVRNLVFYSGIKTTDLITDDQVRDFLSQPKRALMVVPAETMDRLERERGMKVNRVGELLYFNEAGIRVRTLLWPDTSRDLTRVVLITNR